MTTVQPFSPLTAAIAAQIHRHCMADGPGDWAENAAVLIVSSGPVREGLTALDQRDAVLALHTPYRWAEHSPTVECRHCLKSWPCATVELLGAA